MYLNHGRWLRTFRLCPGWSLIWDVFKFSTNKALDKKKMSWSLIWDVFKFHTTISCMCLVNRWSLIWDVFKWSRKDIEVMANKGWSLTWDILFIEQYFTKLFRLDFVNIQHSFTSCCIITVLWKVYKAEVQLGLVLSILSDNG